MFAGDVMKQVTDTATLVLPVLLPVMIGQFLKWLQCSSIEQEHYSKVQCVAIQCLWAVSYLHNRVTRDVAENILHIVLFFPFQACHING